MSAEQDCRIGSLVSKFGNTCAFSKSYPPEKLCRLAMSDSLKFMTAWGLQWLSGVRERLRQRRDLLLEFIVLRHQLAVLQRTGVPNQTTNFGTYSLRQRALGDPNKWIKF